VAVVLGWGAPVLVKVPGGGVVLVVLGWGAPLLMNVAVLSWGGWFMVGIVWKGREDGKEQQSDDSDFNSKWSRVMRITVVQCV
jgi:hypothetical protein